MSIALEYDPRFSRPGTWMVNALASGVRARVPFDDGDERVVDLELRWRRTHAEAPGAVYTHPRDETTWVTEPCALDPDLPRCQLELRGTPPHIDAALRRL
jgi:hypothetical protein